MKPCCLVDILYLNITSQRERSSKELVLNLKFKISSHHPNAYISNTLVVTNLTDSRMSCNKLSKDIIIRAVLCVSTNCKLGATSGGLI